MGVLSVGGKGVEVSAQAQRRGCRPQDRSGRSIELFAGASPRAKSGALAFNYCRKMIWNDT
jgi:hypothetical protein